MKKVLSVILSVILIFVMFGCKQEVDTTLEKDKNNFVKLMSTCLYLSVLCYMLIS